MSAENDRSQPEWLLGLFPGFVAEWRDHVYSEPDWAVLREGMRLDIGMDDLRVGASVTHRRGPLGIGRRYLPHYRVSAGAILGLYDLFMTLCSRADFFVDAPGADTLAASEPHPERFRDYSRFQGTGEHAIVHQEPADETRFALALYLMNAAFHWLLYHEESHFLAGHLLYMEEMHAQAAVNEVGDAPMEAERSADLRSLESHADQRAHLQVVRIYGTVPNLFDHPVEEMRTPAQGVRLAIVATGSVLMLFEANRPGASATHPMPLTRLLDAFGVIYTTLAQREPSIYGPNCEEWIDEHSMQWIMDRAMEDLAAVARLLRLSGSIADVVRPLFEVGLGESAHTEELRSVQARLAQMRPALSECQGRIATRTLPRATLDRW